MGFDSANGGIDALIQRLEDLLSGHRELFEWVFGDAVITEDRIQKALGQFVRSMVSYDSRFDQGYAQTFDPSIPGVGLLADFPNFSEDENEGKTHLHDACPIGRSRMQRLPSGAGIHFGWAGTQQWTHSRRNTRIQSAPLTKEYRPDRTIHAWRSIARPSGGH